MSIRSDFDGLEIVHGDILRQDIENLTVTNPVRIIGNIPYNITSSIIFWLIEQLDYCEDAHIMLQTEVADRRVAKVGTKQYGRLTVVVGVYLDVKLCFKIPPDVFYPKPKVYSSLLSFIPKKDFFVHPLCIPACFFWNWIITMIA